ncbi:hypothetical protein MLD38_031942 [Melastoma candidum]|uniref:Uncharacterized protein n=1 Tax=Melastoma candidum TaxID=119954 RepID=A0ACB9MQL9_9MYRT|nr:hypothetical protein MLD38_031942 [Melastoma candidum]
MEKAVTEEGTAAASSASAPARPKLLRYALRSGIKSKEEKPEPTPSVIPSAPRSVRGRSTPTVSKSMGVLDVSAKEKSVKPPSRRMSIPAKSAVSSASRPAGSVTPVPEAGSRRSMRSGAQPSRDLNRSPARQKALLSSTTYWLSQIKISESAAKHPVSLGFFKLAVEAGCKPAEKMQEELRSYVKRHNLTHASSELMLEELFECYNISESFKQLQIDEPPSDVTDEAMRSSIDEDARSSSSVAMARKLKPKSLNSEVGSGKEAIPKKPTSRVRESVQENQVKVARPGGVTGARKSQNKSAKLVKQEVVKGKEKPDRRGKKPNVDEGEDVTFVTGNAREDKENVAVSAA